MIAHLLRRHVRLELETEELALDRLEVELGLVRLALAEEVGRPLEDAHARPDLAELVHHGDEPRDLDPVREEDRAGVVDGARERLAEEGAVLLGPQRVEVDREDALVLRRRLADDRELLLELAPDPVLLDLVVRLDEEHPVHRELPRDDLLEELDRHLDREGALEDLRAIARARLLELLGEDALFLERDGRDVAHLVQVDLDQILLPRVGLLSVQGRPLSPLTLSSPLRTLPTVGSTPTLERPGRSRVLAAPDPG